MFWPLKKVSNNIIGTSVLDFVCKRGASKGASESGNCESFFDPHVRHFVQMVSQICDVGVGQLSMNCQSVL